jgi:plasmid maintenance system antidote protein VapI
MPMKNPPHPGGFVLRQCIEPLGLSITDAAAALGQRRRPPPSNRSRTILRTRSKVCFAVTHKPRACARSASH